MEMTAIPASREPDPSSRVREKLSQAARTMEDMKRITLEIEMEEDSNLVTWNLEDWRGLVSSGASVDLTEHLVPMWAGDIEQVIDEARGDVELPGASGQ